MTNPKSNRLRLEGLDALRGLCALVVVLGHVNLPSGGNGGLEGMVRFLFRILSNGPAAVIVFFVVSGLCIHLPQASGRPLHVPTFYLRRSIRIGLPIAVGWLLAWSAGCLPAFNGVLWSLVCEAIYYLLYPFLRILAIRFGWPAVLGASVLGALTVLASDPGAQAYPQFGYSLTWILGLPVWIFGCMLAESLVGDSSRGSMPKLWASRGAIFVSSALAIVLQWKLDRWAVGYPWTMTAFGVVAWWWLGQELRHLKVSPPPRWLDVAGLASYSVYLVHPVVIHFGWLLLGKQSGSTLWFRFCLVAGSLAAGLLFYLAVERPSHRLAASRDLRKADQA